MTKMKEPTPQPSIEKASEAQVKDSKAQSHENQRNTGGARTGGPGKSHKRKDERQNKNGHKQTQKQNKRQRAKKTHINKQTTNVQRGGARGLLT